jgi:hypothetical protein
MLRYRIKPLNSDGYLSFMSDRTGCPKGTLLVSLSSLGRLHYFMW